MSVKWHTTRGGIVMKRRWMRSLVLVMFVALMATAALLVVACGEEAATTTTAAPTTTSVEATTTTGGTPTTAGETTTTAAAATIKKIGVIVPEKANDYGWNQQHAEAGKKMADKIVAEYVLADGAGYGDPAPVMRQLVQDGCEWILAGASGYMTVAKQVAAETKVKFNVIFSQENVPDNIQDIQTYAEQGAYLAGVLAAKTTKTGTVGIIVSADDENWTKMSAGFILAAKATKPEIKIKLAQQS